MHPQHPVRAAKCHTITSFAGVAGSRLGRYAQGQKRGVEWLRTRGQRSNQKRLFRGVTGDG